MGLTTFSSIPPVEKTPLVDRMTGFLSLGWLPFFNLVGKRIAAVRVFSVDYDPASIVSGGWHSAVVTIPGVTAGDFAIAASFEPLVPGVHLLADVNVDNTVTVSFLNLTGGTVDMPSGVLRVEVERKP